MRPIRTAVVRSCAAFVAALLVAKPAPADWSNMGGNAGRNAQSPALGPTAATPLWTTGPSSIIAWHPVIDGERVFVVRQTAFPPGGEPGGSKVYALDLHTGGVQWSRDIPFETGDWTTWILGARDGRVYAARSGNGATSLAKVYALDQADGTDVWMSDDEIDAGAYDGVVFAPDGDLVVGSFRTIWRIDAETGHTVWAADRLCSVSGNCGCALGDDGVYVADAVPGGHAIKRFDLATGAFGYQGPTMPGFTLQNTPMVGPDGSIYLSRTQNNAATDFFYAFADTGAAIVEKWHVPAAWSTASEFGVGADGLVYMFKPGYQLVGLDPDDGTVVADGGAYAGVSAPRMAIDAAGRVYLSNSAFATGRLYALTADLAPIWNVPVVNINIGGPALARDGTLVVCGNGTQLRAYRTEPACPGDANADGTVDFDDVLAILSAWGPCPGCTEDLDASGDVDFSDLLLVLSDWGCG